MADHFQQQARMAMRYPFSEIGTPGYSLDDIRQHIIVEQPGDESSHGDFPNNIESFHYFRQGTPDEERWHCFGSLTNNTWFYYTAYCDYTGFDCRGGMELYVSYSLENLMRYAVPPALVKDIRSSLAKHILIGESA